jgi:hypothetical protein
MGKATRVGFVVGIVIVTGAVLTGALVTTHPSPVQAVAVAAEKSTPPVDQTYVGVKDCASCHEKAFEAWEKTGHSRAFGMLTEKYEKDPKCLKCHTTGYGTPTGYKDESTPDLKGITCETCHGPGSKHSEICKAFGDKKLSEEEEDLAKHSIWEVLPKNVCIKCHTRMAHEESQTPEELRHHKKEKE